MKQFNRSVAEQVYGETIPAGLDEYQGEWGYMRDAGGNAWWFESRWPRDYAVDPSADLSTLRLVRDKWAKADIDLFLVALRDLQSERPHTGTVLAYEVGDYSRAALAVVVAQKPQISRAQ
jgi:hypothetical protein